jgi:glutathione synthase/RimK-type ligase-like ATP-grasp enzyme
MTVTASNYQPQIAIATVEDDFHAYAIRKTLQDRHAIKCHIIETDRLADSGKLTWSPTAAYAPILPTLGGQEINVQELDVVWWRRPSGTSWKKSHQPQLPPDVVDEAAIDVILNDCVASFAGIMLNEFRGVWINHPDASRKAENKLSQLRAAMQAGLRIPNTLVSQDPQIIRHFCMGLNNQAIVKTVAGTTKAPLTTHQVNYALLSSDRTLQLSPAIYQEMILGSRHLRVNAFGDHFYAALISCDRLDWRVHLDEVVVEPYQLPKETEDGLRRFMAIMGLRMGIFDLKLDVNGEPIWLEVNPQGQFLFVEGLSEMKLADAFADFLVQEGTNYSSQLRHQQSNSLHL